MIHIAIAHIANHLNQYLKRTFDLNEDIVVTSNIVEQDGTVVSHINNKLVMCLINVEKDTVALRQQMNGNSGGQRIVTGPPPLYFNLYLMVIGHFSSNNYSEALKFLSNSISFFQRSPVFDHASTPDLDKRIDRLVLDIENLNFQDLSNVWGVLGGRYLPSVLYKVRMVVFDAGDVMGQTATVQEPQYSIHA